MRSYIGLVRDHSASMFPHRNLAMKDYNENLKVLSDSARESGLDTYASVVKCGVGHAALVEREVSRQSVFGLVPLKSYQADGSRTPLWDSVSAAIDDLVIAGDTEAAYLVMVTTDGLENASVQISGSSLRKRIQQLQGTDRWSFTFRVPRGYARPLISALGVADGNVLEWEQTAKGYEEATRAQGLAISGYYNTLRTGRTSTTRFYADLDNLQPDDLSSQLHDITNRVEMRTVGNGRPSIKEFCEQWRNTPYVRGLAFYQLVKPELVQDRKEIAIRDRDSEAIYLGAAARDLLKMPRYGAIRLHPGHHRRYELYVQSHSTNRILPFGSKVLYLVR